MGTAIVYEKLFAETHDMTEHLSMVGERQPFVDDQELDEVNFDIGSVQQPLCRRPGSGVGGSFYRQWGF